MVGIVEANATYISGKKVNKREIKKSKSRRGRVGKVAVLGMRERGDEVIYRLNEGNCKVHTIYRVYAMIKKTISLRLNYADLIGA